MPNPLHECHSRRKLICGAVLSIALSLLTLGLPAWGASKPAAPAPAAQAPVKAASEGPQIYEVTEVIPRSERALARLREIRAKLDADRSIQLIEEQLPRVTEQLDEWWKTEIKTLREGRSVQRINDLAWELLSRSTQIEGWKVLLAHDSKAWVSESQALVRGLATWRATRAALKADAPAQVRDKIDEVLSQIDTLAQLLRNKSARLIAVQGRLAALSATLDEVREEFDAVRLHSARSLFTQDSRSLWTLLFDSPGEQPFATQIAAGWAKLKSDVLHLAEILRADAALNLTAFVGLLALFIGLRSRSREPSAIRPTSAEQLVLERSFFSTLLLTLTMVPLLYPDQSPRILRLVVIPVLLTGLVLMPAIFAARLRITYYFFTGIFLLDFTRNYLQPQWPSARLLLFSVSALGAAGIAMLLIQERRREATHNRFGGAIYSLSLVGMALFLGSAIANLTGNVSLAEYLVSPLIRLLFLAVTIRLGVVVATTFAVMALRTRVALLSRVIRHKGGAAAAQVRRLINLAGVGLWIYLALFNLGLLASMQQGFDTIMKTEWEVGAAVISVGDFVMFFLVLFASYLVSRILRLMLAEEIFPRFRFPRGVPDTLVLLARYGVLLFGFLLALSSAGVDLGKVTLALSALGVGIGFGLQNVVNNFVCGLILVFEHPIQVGDYIEVGTHYGKVTRIGFRSSMVLTRDGAEVVIPNAELIGSKVVNWSLSDAIRRLSIPVPVSFGTDTPRMIELLQSVASANALVHTDPPPKAILEQFSDNALRFVLHCWVRTEQMNHVRDELTLAIDQALHEAGIGTPFRQIRIAPTEVPK